MSDFKHFGKAGATIVSIGTLFAASQALADFVILDDLIVDGSACIGFDCVNGESFGFDTIRLKENNLRIKFDDTSTAASFPRNDWQITINDSANGGTSKFSIDDISGGRTPFTIEANARSHSLYVDDGGRIGNRTSTPSTELHIVDGDTATVRLQQDGTAGFAPQTWDVAGNETNFFVRDVSNGSTLPLRIRPGAPSSSIFIDVDGDVGIGSSSPDAALNVERSDGTAKLLVGDLGTGSDFLTMLELNNAGTGGIAYRMTTNGLSIDTNNISGEYRINIVDGDNQELALDADGNLTIDGEITTSGSCSGGCDRVFDAGYALPTIEQQAAAMWANRHLPNVGPTPEDAPFNISRKVGGILNELEKAHIYIAQLHARIERLETRFDASDDH
ncbi:hypothetical protein [Breoghania sp. L-A4]|uniref:hypothetical protein n=1 Tax=Breoghania sp. L-A4 TaxID=2304600 RepID=UPI000E35FBC1|nr:hypothetical protein [Breoghania sp. L-A4]AXS39855.1 hypothetical protein D1F64_07070 [Breoghania sp. L-A4]